MKSILALALAFALVTPGSVFALQTELPQGLTLCEYYVEPTDTLVQVSSELSEIVQGGTMAFSGLLKNQGELPLIDAQLFVKVVSDGAFVVDLLPVTLPAHVAPQQEVPFTIEWTVPYTLEAGDYAADVVVHALGRTALVGSFGSGDLLSPYAFKVVGDGTEEVYVDVPGGLISAPEDGPITVEVPIVNDSESPLKTTMEWTVYEWNGPRADRALTPFVSEVKIHPETRGSTVFTLPEGKGGEYFAEGKMLVNNVLVKTYLSIERTGFRGAKLTLAGIARAETDGSKAAFVCVESPDVPTDTVDLKLESRWSVLGITWPFAKSSFTGSIPAGSAYALAAPLASGAQGDVVATLSRGGEVIDTLEVSYGGSPDIGTLWPYIAGIVLLLVVLIGGIFFVRRH